ncbi:MAG: hypothetical protein WKF83_08800 [Nocardioidaceae bacterium]
MIAMTLGELAEITDGRLHGVAASAVVDSGAGHRLTPGRAWRALRRDPR